MAKPMSLKSVSFSRVGKSLESQSERFKNEVSFLPIRSKDPTKVTQMTYLKGWSLCLQSVFRAEMVKTLKLSEIQAHLKNLNYILEKTEPDKIWKISCHPQSDNTTKSAHFHLWGDVTQKMEKVFDEYLKNNRLTLVENSNITSISAGELVEVKLNEDGKEEFRGVKFTKESGHFKAGKSEFNATKSEVFKELAVSKTDKNIEKIEEKIETKADERSQKLEDIKLKYANQKFEIQIENQKFEKRMKKIEEKRELLNENVDNFLAKLEQKREKLSKYRVKNTIKEEV